ncbi:uncharacterized protein LDX57_012786 [Aspergillus melleus]|uniref:uncharacterized protein n=1 Tax=Aspergillus melleus TaxID=138277 RepID=UPI001E8E4FE9|nr:uncharacterized protein LDX57_012786 [Aspergillus melleus]KAH8435157.1 hypothetical protein LDX57_012786 [Aspergillus melleus]
MPDPVELQLFPSCLNCLSWSEDGELAVAAGDHVQILTPKKATEGAEPASSARQPSAWQIARVRTNVFTDEELPTILGQHRDYFSIGREQSLSNVAGLAWSPPGVGKSRRCVLAVLTSNMVLSLFETVGSQGKWIRVALVNQVLSQRAQSLTQREGERVRKSSITSFAWCPPLKVPASEDKETRGAESKWGIQLLSVVTDENEVILLRPTRTSTGYSIEVLSSVFIEDSHLEYPQVQPGSVLSTILKKQTKSLSLDCGPWFYRVGGKGTQAASSATANVAVLYGTTVKLFTLDISLARDEEQQQSQPRYKVTANCQENTLVQWPNMNYYHCTGPLQWLYKVATVVKAQFYNPAYHHQDKSPELRLAAGTLGGMLQVIIPSSSYDGTGAASQPQLQESIFETNTDSAGSEERGHWEAIGGMAAIYDKQTDSQTLHLGTIGGYTLSMIPSPDHTSYQFSEPPWKQQFDGIREQFDIDGDLGGLAIGRIWGLANYRGLVATAFTLNPGDLIEYRTAAEERSTIIFSRAYEPARESDDSIIRPAEPDRSPSFLRAMREEILSYILFSNNGKFDQQPWGPKLIYAAACCTIVESQDAKLLSQAQKALQWLAKTTGVDLSEEMDKIKDRINNRSAPGTAVGAKSAEQLTGPGERVFEKCEVCDAGIGWHSGQEAQCASGHLFVRCGLTLLSIQDPGISKFCSYCGTEFLNEELTASSQEPELQKASTLLSDVFDTCIYCNGKFRY